MTILINQDGSHYECIIPKSDMDKDWDLFPIVMSDGTTIASLKWMGGTINQPALVSRNGVVFSLSFDGFTYNSDIRDRLHYPACGEVKLCASDTPYYFSNLNIDNPDPNYALEGNNCSMRIDNASIFMTNYSRGCMLNMRASFEGNSSETSASEGQVVILAVYDTIL